MRQPRRRSAPSSPFDPSALPHPSARPTAGASSGATSPTAAPRATVASRSTVVPRAAVALCTDAAQRSTALPSARGAAGAAIALLLLLAGGAGAVGSAAAPGAAPTAAAAPARTAPSVAAPAGGAAGGAEARRSIRDTDLFRFVWVADPHLSPDGRRVAFVRVTVNAKHDGYEEALWIAASNPHDPVALGDPGLSGADAVARPLTSGPHDSAPRWSPDGRRLAFVRRTADAPPQIYVLPLDGGEARPLTKLPHGASSPVWSPDGRTLAFVSDANPADLAKAAKASAKADAAAQNGDDAPAKAGDAPAETVAAKASAGAHVNAAARADAAKGRGEATAAANPDAAAKQAPRGSAKADTPDGKPAAKADAAAEPEHVSDVKVISRAVYRFNGAGYDDTTHHAHLWTVAVPAGAAEAPAPHQLTTGDFDEHDAVWAPDGTRLYLLSERDKEPYYQESTMAVYSVPAAGGELTRVTGIRGNIGGLTVSPDGRSLAFVGAEEAKPARSYDKPDLWVADAAPGSVPRNLTAHLDADVAGGLTGDQHAPRAGGGPHPLWAPSGRSILMKVADHGRVDLRRFDAATGNAEEVFGGPLEVVEFAATADLSRLALIVSTPVEVGDLFILDLPAKPGGTAPASAPASAPAARQVTAFNEALFAHLDITAPEEITYRSFDGRPIQTWVQYPPGYQPGHPPAGGYPMILDIHGGPHAAHGYTFFHEVQWWAAKGYVVLYPNPRGSTTYGEEFGNVIQYHYPGDDYKDLMAGVDELIRRGVVDPHRLAVTGGSGGGLLTNWVVTQTDRFAAAASQRSISDWSAWWYTADFTLFTPRWFRAAPFEDPQDFAARSPITYVAKVKTPLMLIEGEADYRTPPASGGESMFRALKYLHKPVVMVRFPGESHELSRSGNPWHRVERLQHIVRWFDKYVMGIKTDLYDVPEEAK